MFVHHRHVHHRHPSHKHHLHHHHSHHHFAHHHGHAHLLHHQPVHAIWARPMLLDDLSALDSLSMDYAVVFLAALASAGVSATPGIPALISWDTAVNEAMVLFILRHNLTRHVGRAEAKQALVEVGHSTYLTYKGAKHVIHAAKWARRSGHPLGAGLHAVVSGTSTFAVGLAAMRAVEKKQQQTVPVSIRAAMPEALDSSLAWGSRR
jgi:hypothetical protein